MQLDDLTDYLLRETTGWPHLKLPVIAMDPQEIPIGRGRHYSRKVGEVLHPAFESEFCAENATRLDGTYAILSPISAAPHPG